jgi:Protein of unknown function (DUF4244)
MTCRIPTDEGGHSTAEYAIGLTAACALAGLLGWCATSDWYAALLRYVFEIAMLLSHVPRIIL